MNRRQFIRDSGLTAVGIGAFGSISWSNDRFISDSPTTTDILGPFYRPGAPIRKNINPPGYSGQRFHLTGKIFREDEKTPFRNCLIEIWQCDENTMYDNTSDSYHYRGSQKTGSNGKYHFITTHPVPYPTLADPNISRPAHIHLRISGDGHQDLITQVYFKEDPHIPTDPAANSPRSINKILTISRNPDHEETVNFDIVMSTEYKPDDSVYARLAGVYKMSDKSLMEFYRQGDSLFWKWNGQILEGLTYQGNNEFSGPFNNAVAKFAMQEDGGVKVDFYHLNLRSKKENKLDGIKIFKY
jgi:catechol 1,2-dioxygenase